MLIFKRKLMNKNITIDDVRSFWNNNPLCASAIPFAVGSSDYFNYYDKMREKNESIDFSYKLHEYKKFKGKKVLDVGCGNGYVLNKYALEGAEVFGIDITQIAVDICKKRFDIYGLKGNFQIGSAEDLPFEDETFDCVCSMGVLHHTPNTEKAVKEIYRVLKKGGRLILMFYHRNSAWYRIKMPIQKIFTGQNIQVLVNEVDGVGNPKGDVYSKSELSRLLCDFSSREMFVGLLNWWMIVPKGGGFLPDVLLKPFAKWFGWFLYAKAIKP
jgi:ubiquinone/menaquinone biosynthesis C-methylase UbiE